MKKTATRVILAAMLVFLMISSAMAAAPKFLTISTGPWAENGTSSEAYSPSY